MRPFRVVRVCVAVAVVAAVGVRRYVRAHHTLEPAQASAPSR